MELDSFRDKGKRAQLVKYLEETKGIQDQNVLQAINKIPRHIFIDSVFQDFAYEDKAFPILSNQTISAPYTVAFQSQLLQIHPNEKILEIGTGSGYQTSVLMKMGAQVYTIERQKELFDFSQEIFSKLNLKPRYQIFGDGYKGLPAFAPFDKIIVTAGAPNIPKALLEQLTIGGVMIIPLGIENQKMLSILKIDDSKFETTEFGDYQFVPMLESKE